MYGKIFHSIYDGTLSEDWRALITFQQLIVLCDADGIVDMTTQAISRRTGIPIEHIDAGINILEKTDAFSRTPDQGGRRIERIDDHRPWGWHIINHKHYRDLRTADDRREYMRVYMAEKRKKEKECNHKLTKPNNSKQLAKLANTDTDTDTDTLKPSRSKNSFSTKDHYLAVHIHSKIKELNPNTKDPNLNKWANEIRLMRERDERHYDEILKIFTWANNDPFWKTNILSPSKLRKQFDQLSVKANMEKGNGSHKQNSKPSLAERLEANRKLAERQIDEQSMGKNGLHIRT